MRQIRKTALLLLLGAMATLSATAQLAVPISTSPSPTPISTTPIAQPYPPKAVEVDLSAALVQYLNSQGFNDLGDFYDYDGDGSADMATVNSILSTAISALPTLFYQDSGYPSNIPGYFEQSFLDELSNGVSSEAPNMIGNISSTTIQETMTLPPEITYFRITDGIRMNSDGSLNDPQIGAQTRMARGHHLPAPARRPATDPPSAPRVGRARPW